MAATLQMVAGRACVIACLEVSTLSGHPLPPPLSRSCSLSCPFKLPISNPNLILKPQCPCPILPIMILSITLNPLLALSAATAMIAVPIGYTTRFLALDGPPNFTFPGVPCVELLGRASRHSQQSTDRQSGSKTRRRDPSVGLEHGRCAQLPAAEKQVCISRATSERSYFDIRISRCCIRCRIRHRRNLPSTSVYPDIERRYRKTISQF